MKKIICEMCEGTEFVKENGMFVCQECGMKYSVEEAKKLMREVGETPTMPAAEIPAPAKTKKKKSSKPVVEQKPVIMEEDEDDENDVDELDEDEEIDEDEELDDEIDDEEDNEDEPIVKKPKTKKAGEKEEKKKSKIDIPFIIGIVACVFFAVMFIGNCAGAVDGEEGANVWLLIFGIIQIAGSLILNKVMQYRKRNICPECGTKREHHREYLDTTEKYKETNGSQGVTRETTTYTHHYHDTYTCPNCGETFEEDVKESGGEYVEDMTGVHDRRREPKEF